MSSPEPAGVALATLSFVVIILLIGPLVWHCKSRNVPAASLISWILISNLVNFLNVLIWPNDDFEGRWDGSGLCDIEVKLAVGRSTALPGATLCILKGLADVMDCNKVNLAPSRAQRVRKRVIELAWCIGVPILSMLLHLVVQPNRYIIYGVTGCAPSYDQSWPTIVLMHVVPILITLGAAFYCCLIVHRLRRFRSAFAGMLTASGTTKARFLRLLILALIFIFILLPVQAWVLFLNFPAVQYTYSWNRIHSAAAWRTIAWIPSGMDYLQDRWISLGSGFLVFFVLGLGQEAQATYRSWMLAVGLGRIFPSLAVTPGTTPAGSRASSQNKFWSPARLCGVPRRWSKRIVDGSWSSNSDRTLLSSDDGTHKELDIMVVKDVTVVTTAEKEDSKERW